jgi:drug/metabolite transporter (DMT)-like permease
VNRRAAADLALVWNTVIWGSTFVLVKSALNAVSPVLFLSLRFGAATLALLLLFFKRRGVCRKAEPRAIGIGALIGLFLFLGYLFQTLGLQFTSAPKSAFLTGLTSVTVPLLSSLVYRSRPQISELTGVMMATAGLGLMTLQGGVGSLETINRGDLLTILCALAFAAHIVALGHFSRLMSFELLSVTQVAAAAVLSLSLFRWTETPRIEWQPTVLYAILITGLFATALAFTIQAWAQRHTTATRTALIYMLEPVVAWMTSYLLVGEGLSGRAAAGAALILGGVLLVELKPLNPRQHPSK